MTTDAQTLAMILGGPKVKKARKPAKKRAVAGASVRLFMNGEVTTIVAKDDRYKNAFFVEGIEFSVSRDMFEVL